MKKIASGQLNDAEVEEFKNLRTGGMLRAYQLGGQLLSWYMAHYEEREVIEDFDGWINKLRAVTKEQVIEVARHLCSTNARGATLLGKVTDDDAKKFAAILDPVTIH
jgi:fructosamine-3-kinase